MTAARKSVMTACWRLIGLVLAMALLFVVSIQTQEAYAGRKKVSGTGKVITKLVRRTIPCGDPCVPLGFNLRHWMLNSDDPDWNNVQQFVFTHEDRKKEQSYKRYTVNTHPNGDQTVYQSEGTSEPLADDPSGSSWKEEGFFIGGTGKFEGIKGRGTSKGKTIGTEITCEWEAEYETK